MVAVCSRADRRSCRRTVPTNPASPPPMSRTTGPGIPPQVPIRFVGKNRLFGVKEACKFVRPNSEIVSLNLSTERDAPTPGQNRPVHHLRGVTSRLRQCPYLSRSRSGIT